MAKKKKKKGSVTIKARTPEWEDEINEMLSEIDKPGPWDSKYDKPHTIGGLTNDKDRSFMKFQNKIKERPLAEWEKKIGMKSKSKKNRWSYSDTKVKVDKIPDPKLHQQMSFIKSGIRILGYAALWWSIDIAATLLILSEVVGIGEELV